MWRVWIEIKIGVLFLKSHPSPSVWRVWIEIFWMPLRMRMNRVTLRVEGVD